MTSTREEKREYWTNQVNEWKASGETQRGYCRRHHLKPHQLTYWAQVFEEKSHTEHAPTTNGFVAVQVADSPIQGLTIRLPSGLRLEGIHAGNLALTREMIGWLA